MLCWKREWQVQEQNARSIYRMDHQSILSPRLSVFDRVCQRRTDDEHSKKKPMMQAGEGLTRAITLCPFSLKCNSPIRARRLPTCNEAAEGSNPK
jgi:hypothetical protein